MLELIAAMAFVLILITTPHPVVFVVSAVLIGLSLNFRVSMVFRGRPPGRRR